MEGQTPRIFEQLTGQEWQGRFEWGPHDPEKSRQDGWITVIVRDRLDESCDAFGTVGPPAGIVWIDINIVPNEPTENQYSTHCNLRAFAHEMAHVLGFWHNCDRSDPCLESCACGSISLTIDGEESDPGDITYASIIQYHARLAYEIGPGRFYCGWPYNPSCTID